jgi:hypothetical protein
MFINDKPWWETTRATTPEEASALCRRLGTSQCAAICLQHLSLATGDGRCPEASRVWMKLSTGEG